MTTQVMINSSPLGGQSQLYLERSKTRGSILDNPMEGLLQFYPAGFSKQSRRDGASRQEIHRLLWEAAVALKKEEELFPFDGVNHQIEIVPDNANPVDPNAMSLIFKSDDKLFKEMNGADIGYIPGEISAVVRKNLEVVNGIRIYKVRSKWYKKFYSCKVMCAYGATTFENSVEDGEGLDRFSGILSEIR